MSTAGDDFEKCKGGEDVPRDLIDFYRRWADFRKTAVSLAERPDLSSSEQQTVRWLILLVDRIGERDVQP